MNSNSAENEAPPTESCSDRENPRNATPLDNSGRKSWSFIDRKTNYEILQEMGVGLLDPDDGDLNLEQNSTSIPHHRPPKRKRDLENVNPNALAESPRSRSSPRSPKVKYSPGPSRIKSASSTEKSNLLQPTDLNSTVMLEYMVDEETPASQYISADCKHTIMPRTPRKSSELRDSDPLVSGRVTCEPGPVDAFSVLSDEIILCVFKLLPKRTLSLCMLVCKRWNIMARDETLWQRLDLGGKTINKDALGKILDRKPNILRLASSEVGAWHPTSTSPTRIQYLDLSMATIDVETLDNLLNSCPALKKLSLETVTLAANTCKIIGQCKELETLNLTMAQNVNKEGVTAILDGCLGLQSLNISWCNLEEESIEVLVSRLPQKLQRLNLSGARKITDEMVSTLCARCPRLVELDLSDCSLLTAASITSILKLNRLDHLAMSRCYALTAHALTNLARMPSLQYIDVWGMLQTPATTSLRAALPGIQVNQFMFSAIARPTVGPRRSSIWGLRTRD